MSWGEAQFVQAARNAARVRRLNFEAHVAECVRCTTATRGHSDDRVATFCAAGNTMLALYVASIQAEAEAEAIQTEARPPEKGVP